MGNLEGARGTIIVADLGISGTIRHKGRILPDNTRSIDGVDLPGQSVQGGVFQVLVCLVVIADVRHSGAVKPERAVLADRPGGIRGLDLPG